MQGLYYREQCNFNSSAWPKLRQRMIYLPGAVVIPYAIWLSLTV